MKKIILTILTLVPFITKAQVTLIPDQQFEQYLIAANIDSDGIVNGQILTNDALAVTDLFLWGEGINDLGGLQDFVNLEKLTCYYNPLNGNYGVPYGTINLGTLLNLKELDVRASHLNTIDVSNNALLEKIFIGNESGGDIPIISDFTKLDLSNNPNINHVDATHLFNTFTLLNMRNNIANNVYIDVSSVMINSPTVCIEVDDPVAATNGTAPYDTWTVIGNHYYNQNCALSVEKFVNDNFKIYPNPATAYVSIEQKTTDGVTLKSVQILDSSGKWIKSVKDNFNHIDISNLSKGMYLFVIQTDKGNKTEKIIVK